MAVSFLLNLFRKRRKYPIRPDEFGKSARRRAFDAFDQGLRPARVAREVGISLQTACRYFADWKKLSPGLKRRYDLVRDILKNHPELSEKVIRTIADELGMSVEEVIERLQKPWGIKQLLMGRWPNYAREERQSKCESRLRAALELIQLIEHSGMTAQEIAPVLNRLIREARKHKAGG